MSKEPKPSKSSPVKEDRLKSIFSQLDKDKDGHISVSELSAVMRGHSADSDRRAEQVLSAGDRNADQSMSFDEFLNYIQNHETQLRLAFDNLDRNKDQRVDANEIQQAMADLGVTVSLEDAQKLLQKMDRNHNLTIDFEEWRDFLIFSGTSDLREIFSYWHHSTAIDIGENGVVPDDFSETEKKTGVASKTMIAGGVAGAVSRTATAPLDRIKMFWQAQAGTKSSHKMSMTSAFREMVREGGVASLFRGNGVNVLKIAPETALKFLTYENYKKLILFGEKRDVTLMEKFVAGGLAGATAQTVIYPMEVLKTRMCLRKTGQYSSIFDCARKVYKEGGMAVFYRGYVPNILGILPYAGIDLALFETFKNVWIQRQPKKGGNPPVYVSLVAGAVSSVCGQVATYPLALVRTKLQMLGKTHGEKPSMVSMFRSIVAREGPLGLYRGMGPNMLKVIPAVSISYATFDMTRNYLIGSK